MKQKNKQPSKRHTFDFEGGDDLTTMGASWFISYLYHIEIDSNHRNWEVPKTKNGRVSVFLRTKCLSTAKGVAISSAMIQGDRIAIQGTNGRTDIYELSTASDLMSI